MAMRTGIAWSFEPNSTALTTNISLDFNSEAWSIPADSPSAIILNKSMINRRCPMVDLLHRPVRSRVEAQAVAQVSQKTALSVQYRSAQARG